MSKLSEFLAKGREDKPGLMKRGNLARAKRDVLARRLAKAKNRVKESYGLATFMTKAGAHIAERSPGDKMPVSQEFAEQKAAAKKKKKW